jgi:hypothetical protein
MDMTLEMQTDFSENRRYDWEKRRVYVFEHDNNQKIVVLSLMDNDQIRIRWMRWDGKKWKYQRFHPDIHINDFMDLIEKAQKEGILPSIQ